MECHKKEGVMSRESLTHQNQSRRFLRTALAVVALMLGSPPAAEADIVRLSRDAPPNAYTLDVKDGVTTLRGVYVQHPRTKKYLNGLYKVVITYLDRTTENRTIEFVDGNADYGKVDGAKEVNKVFVDVG
jgi:hypothetical protein